MAGSLTGRGLELKAGKLCMQVLKIPTSWIDLSKASNPWGKNVNFKNAISEFLILYLI